MDFSILEFKFNSNVVVELGLRTFTKKEEGVIRIYGGSADLWSKKFLYHGVQIDHEVKFEFLFPLTMKDKLVDAQLLP